MKLKAVCRFKCGTNFVHTCHIRSVLLIVGSENVLKGSLTGLSEAFFSHLSNLIS